MRPGSSSSSSSSFFSTFTLQRLNASTNLTFLGVKSIYPMPQKAGGLSPNPPTPFLSLFSLLEQKVGDKSDDVDRHPATGKPTPALPSEARLAMHL